MTAIKDLTDAQAGHGTLSYNGYTFGAFRNFTISLEPEYDDAGQALVGNRLTLHVTSQISGTAESDMGTLVSTIRRALTEPGKTLVIADVGFGDMSINGTSATPSLNKTHDDIEFGPKPKVLGFEPLGGGVSWELDWAVESFIRDCPGTTGSGLAFAAFNYSSTYRINDEGLTQRVISGRARIPHTRTSGGTTLSKTPDQLREKIKFPIPVGFRRADQVYRVDESRCWLEFAIVDEELPGAAPPDHIINCDLDYDFDNIPPGFEQWEATLSGTMTVAPGRSPSRGAGAFWLVALDKLRKLQQAVRPKGVVIPTRIGFGHKLFSRTSRGRIQFTVVHCLDSLLKDAGIWSPVEGTGYQQWSASMSEVFSPRGVAGLRQNQSSVIVDLCGNITTRNMPPDFQSNRTESWEPSGLLRMDGITEENSWFAFENNLKSQRKENVSLSTTIRKHEGYQPSQGGNGVRYPSTGSLNDASAVNIEYGSTPDDSVLMYGKALRLKFQPSVPALVDVGGVKVTQLDQKVDGPKAVACFFGVTVYLVRWAILYKLNGHLSSVPPPPQAICCETGTQLANVMGGAK